ncbi:response regulator [Thiobacillus sedimenti]|uniref:Response regulator n=1 Tax=Thiobacillus sedimenti TaxID=3110231 RepID=A0ABZ1CMG6_9PROT|nr:response regulator [Thiobacillus sp. SCUT-2]WRS40592.1 response regulator [Thiobacillus sp. SCUT-2]
MSEPKRATYYTTREAARKIGVSLTTIQLWVESGVLSAWKTAGGHRRIPSDAVDAMLAGQRAAEGHAAPAHSVLIVEDEPVLRELYRIKFAEWKLAATLHLAQDGFDGLVMFGKYAPQLVIADLVMPGMDGFEMIRRLTQITEGAPAIVVVTALSAAEIDAHGGLPASIPVYSKPAPLGVLRHIVERTLRQATR